MCTLIATLNESSPDVLSLMAQATCHRGPDRLDISPNSRHGLAAARLVIYGESDASAIYHDKKNDRYILLNGEIYNYSELWAELKKIGIHPNTHLEGELIAELYTHHGLDFAGRLKGMFAIIVLDEEKIILARDRFGIKPLYYTKKGQKILVCSEIKGLLKHPDVTPTLNRHALEETKVFGYVASQTDTFFNSIHQVHPGTVMVGDDSGIREVSRFGRLSSAKYNEETDCMNLYIQVIKERLIAAVDRMFKHGNMDKGIFLSGGLDSSIITMVATKILGYKVSTFTLADNPYAPDFQAAHRIAEELDTDHHEYLVEIDDYWRLLPDYVAHYESLMAGGVFDIQGGMAFHLLSQKVAANAKVAFSGEGADELFGGYYWIYTHPLGFSDRIRGNLRGLEHNKQLKNMVDELFPEPEEERLYRRNLFDFLLRGGLSNYHLQSVDRSAGAFGFEIRPIYLDDDLSRLAMELPIEYKTPDKNTTKKILREAFADDFKQMGLGWVTTRKKTGMPAALDKIQPLLGDEVEKTISDRELFDHPLSGLLGSKMNLLLYDLFEHIFFNGWNHHDPTPPSGSLLERVWPA